MTRTAPLLVFLLLAAPSSASAFSLGVDAHLVQLLNASERSGLGASLRLGWTLDVPGVALTIEGGGTLAGLTSEEVDVEADLIGGAFAGARLGLGEIVRPSAFAHVGYAVYDHPTLAADRAGARVERVSGGQGVFGRAGLALDLVVSVLSAGVHVGYGRFLSGDFEGGDQPAWVMAGLQAALTF